MKNLLLIAFVAFSISANAQFTIWEDDFNDGNISDWTVWDVNADAQSWIACKDIQLDGAGAPSLTLGQHSILGVYAIDMTTGMPLGNGDGNYPFDHEWVVAPAIDLSFYKGPTQLILNAQPGIYDANLDLYIYASTTLERESFTVIDTLVLERSGGSTNLMFKDYTVDISEFNGEEKVYFAFVTINSNFVGYEIDNMKITATEIVSGIEEVKKAPTKIEQNPVTETLRLQLGDAALNSDNLNIRIYNLSGALVKESVYNETGISVSELSSGMYFMELSGENVVERSKFIKK